MAEIAVGNRVVLVSGGPAMTVDRIVDINGVVTAWCSWCDDDRRRNQRTFSVAALKLSDAPNV